MLRPSAVSAGPAHDEHVLAWTRREPNQVIQLEQGYWAHPAAKGERPGVPGRLDKTVLGMHLVIAHG